MFINYDDGFVENHQSLAPLLALVRPSWPPLLGLLAQNGVGDLMTHNINIHKFVVGTPLPTPHHTHARTHERTHARTHTLQKHVLL